MIEEQIGPAVEAHAHLSNLLRTLVTAAGGLAGKAAQRRAERLRDAEHYNDQQRQALSERVRAERQAARLVYRHVHAERWWDKARPKEIAHAVVAAGTWGDSDPAAAYALAVIGGHLHDRYGLNLGDLFRQAGERHQPLGLDGFPGGNIRRPAGVAAGRFAGPVEAEEASFST